MSNCPRNSVDCSRTFFLARCTVRQLGAGGFSDMAVWQLAQEHDCLLVTKDEDFHCLSVLRGAPPKVIWLRIGNCSTDDVAVVLRKHSADINRFAEQNEATFFELG